MKKVINSKPTDLEIIILTYNSEFWLKKTLASLEQFYLSKTKFKVEVTVVDNASSDNTSKLISSEFNWVKYLPLTENRGFAVANNQAISESKAKFVMLLNSDMELTDQSNLDELILQMIKGPKIGILTPRVEFSNGQIDPACHRGEPTLWASFCYFFGLETLFKSSPKFAQYHQWYKDLNQVHSIDACSGAAMIVRNSAIQKVGLLDERFFMYAEDLDWCRRFREAGYQIIYSPQAKIIHHKYKSGIKSSSKIIARQTRKHFYQTMLQYYDKYYGTKYPKIFRWILKVLITIKQGAL